MQWKSLLKNIGCAAIIFVLFYLMFWGREGRLVMYLKALIPGTWTSSTLIIAIMLVSFIIFIVLVVSFLIKKFNPQPP